MNLIKYVNSKKAIKDIFSNEKVEIEDLSSGINEVYLLFSKSSDRKVILKRALPYFKKHPNKPLDIKRVFFEAAALKLFEKFISGYSPNVYFEDKENSIIIIEYIDDSINLNSSIQKGVYLPSLSDDIAKFLSTIAFKTSIFSTNYKRREELLHFYSENSMKDISRGFIFDSLMELFTITNNNTSMYKNTITQENSYNKRELLIKTKQLRTIFCEDLECLSHGDFKGGAILVDSLKKSYVIDAEFISFAPMGYDIGSIIHLFVSLFINYNITQTSIKYQQWLLELIEDIWHKYKLNFIKLYKEENPSFDEKFINKQFVKILQDTIGFLGIHLLSMNIGLVIPTNAVVTQTKEELEFQYYSKVYGIAKICILKYNQISSIHQLLKIVSSFAQK